jgi:hypothetical protein
MSGPLSPNDIEDRFEEAARTLRPGESHLRNRAGV